MRSTRRVAAATTLAVALLLAGCSGGGGDSSGSGSSSNGDLPEGQPRPTAPASAPPLPSQTMSEDGSSYVWNRVAIGAGGWVTGLVIHPTEPGVMYARTDVGGAYRWNADTSSWDQMILASTVQDRPEPAETDDYQVESIGVSATDPETVYVSVGSNFNPDEGGELPRDGRVMRSTDGGRTWTSSQQRWFVSGNQSARQLGERMAVDPRDPDVAYLGTRREGLWRTADGGATWEQIPPEEVSIGLGEAENVDNVGITFVTFDPDSDEIDGRTSRLYVGVAGAGVYRSDDGGETWARIAEANEAKIAPQEGSIVDGRLLVATNVTNGDGIGKLEIYDPETGSFDDITPPVGTASWAAAIDPSDPQQIIAADNAVRDGSLWRTTDGGENWEAENISIDTPSMPWMSASDIDQWMSIGRLVFDPQQEGRLWFAEGMGVWRTDDVFGTEGDVVWELESDGIEQLVTADMVAPPGGDPVSVVADRQGFLHTDLSRSPGAPLVDERFAGGSDIDYAGQDPQDLVWIGSEYNVYWSPDREARAAFSSDGGASWTELPNLVPDMFAGNVAISATDPRNIVWLPSYFINPWEYEGLPKGIFVTKDLGENWTTLSDVGGSNRFHRLSWWLTRQALASDKVEGGVFYLYDDEEQFFVSTDGGETWEAAPNSPPCREANACHVFGQLKASPDRAGELWASVGNDGLYRTSDRGETPWQKVPGVDSVRAFGFGAPLPGSDRPAIYVNGRANGDPQIGLWRSGDDGATWQLIGRHPLGLYKDVNVVNGDMNVPGRVYVGFSGTGFAYGDDSALS